MEWKESENNFVEPIFWHNWKTNDKLKWHTDYLFCDSHCVVHSKATQGE